MFKQLVNRMYTPCLHPNFTSRTTERVKFNKAKSPSPSTKCPPPPPRFTPTSHSSPCPCITTQTTVYTTSTHPHSTWPPHSTPTPTVQPTILPPSALAPEHPPTYPTTPNHLSHSDPTPLISIDFKPLTVSSSKPLLVPLAQLPYRWHYREYSQ